jgi:hypothetical protein
MVVSDGFEVRVLHCVFRGHSLGVVVLQHFAQQVNGFVGDELVVLRGNELGPWLLGVVAEDVVIVRVELHVVLLYIGEELISSQHFGNLYELVIVVFALEEWLLLKYHSSKHAAQRPYIQTVVVHLQVD